MPKVRDIAGAIEAYAPKALQETWDNPGLQIGDPDMEVTGALLCLDMSESVLSEALEKQCNLIITHHPLLFRGLKQITGATPRERIVAEALRHDIAIYAAHTNLDSTSEGVSHEIAHMLGIENLEVLIPHQGDPGHGLGVIGSLRSGIPTLEFLRKLRETFSVKAIRYSGETTKLVIRRVAVCGGAGAEFITEAIKAGADAYVTGDVKYHDFTEYGSEILIADIGHYESELCTRKIFARILHEHFPDFTFYTSEVEKNPVKYLI